MIRAQPSRCSILWALLALGAAMSPVAGQSWELEVRRVMMDDDGYESFARSGAPIPDGFGLAVRHVWSSGVLFGFELSRGSEERTGAVCGGFVMDMATECIEETVGYRGSLFALSLGWLFGVEVGEAWSFGIGPRGGMGVAWVREAGRQTGREFSESSLAFSVGVGAEARGRLPWYGLSLVASVGADHLRPSRERCLDCWQVLMDPLAQLGFGLGLAWRIP